MKQAKMCSRLLLIAIICSHGTNCLACLSRTVSVVGSAEQELVPDEIWIPLKISTEAKTLGLAMDEFQKISGRLYDTFNAMDFPDLKIDANGKIISNQPPQQANRQQIIMAGNVDQSPPARIYVFEKLVFKLKLNSEAIPSDVVESISQLVDKAIENKAEFDVANSNVYYNGSPVNANLVRATNSRYDQVWKDLSTAAFEDARNQAMELARLADAKLGKVVSIDATANDANSQNVQVPSGADPLVSTLRFCDFGKTLKVRKRVTVRFELE